MQIRRNRRSQYAYEDQRRAHGGREVRGLGRRLELPAGHRHHQRPGRGRDRRQPKGQQRVAEAIGGRLAELVAQVPDIPDQALAAPQQKGERHGE
jgi:hypothetical protein